MRIIYRLHATSTGDIILGSGELNCSSIRQRAGGLHQAFAIGACTHDNRTVEILQRTSQDFRRGSGAAVYQHSDRYIQVKRFTQRLISLARLTRLATGSHQCLPFRHEEIGNLNRLVQQASTIATQVDNQRGSSLALELLEYALELL